MTEGPDDREPPGLWLRRQREAAGLTREELAERSGLSARAISNLERARTRKPYPSSVRLIAGALGLTEVTVNELIARYRASRGARSGPSRQSDEGIAGSLLTSPDGEQDRVGSGLDMVPHQLPAAVQHFTGRRAELAELFALLPSATGEGAAVVISALDGSPGIGKTALAVHWAHRVAADFPDGQLYVNLRSFDPSGEVVRAETAIRGFLDAFQIPAERLPPSQESQAALYRSLLASKRVLIVLDNARDAGQVRPLLPGSPGCLVVVTSRVRLTGLAAAEGARLLTLDALSVGEARELLVCRIGAARVRAEPGAAGELVRLCGRLPLALTVAAARAVARPGMSLAAAVAELADTAGRLRALETGDPATNVRTVFSWSYQNLEELPARIFRLLGVHPGPDITVPAAAALLGATPADTRAVLDTLAMANLLDEQIPGRFALHDLLRAYAAEQAAEQEPESERHAAVRRALDYYLHTGHAAALMLEPHRDPLRLPPPRPGAGPEAIADDRQAMAWFAAEHRVLVAAINLAADLGFDRYAWQLPAIMATFYERRGNWSDHAAVQHIALTAAQRAGDKTGQATAHVYLVYISTMRGSHDSAQRHFQQAQALLRQTGLRTGQARAHLAMGHALDDRGKYHEAMQHAKRALELYRTEGHQGGQAVALHNIGWTQGQLGHRRQALNSLQQALDLLRALGHLPGEAAAWGSLGYTHSRLAHHAEAGDCYARAVELHSRLGDLWSQASMLAGLGHARNAAGHTQAALAAWRKAAEILDALHDPDAEKLRAEIEKAQQEGGPLRTG
jgi:tetratricopeptide (TPR) repeat protein/transcriptional regulator with XRE-family HTH domain